jgi:MFS family permease
MQPSLSESGGTSTLERVTWYHWLVVLIASGGWLFDCMDQRIFILARESALKEVSGGLAADAQIKIWIGQATMWMMIGWATGGIFFGWLSDRWGRVKTMVVTLLVYSGFTGLSGMSHSVDQFIAYRFLVGLGVGGMFGAATTLVAESVPGRFRTLALGSLQTLSACGNIIGSALSLGVRPGQADVLFGMSGWRIIFFIGILPAILVVPIVLVLREPERWKEARRRALDGTGDGRKVGSIPDLVSDRRWRRNLLVGVCLGLSGMAGLWGIGFFSPELISTTLRARGETQEVIDQVRAVGTLLQDVGAFFGMLTFTALAGAIGRRKAFFGGFFLCLVITIFVFNRLETRTDAYWMLMLMGFAQLSVFAGYSIYFPELFPTRLRGTGVSFCYNIVRYLAAAFPWALGQLNGLLAAQGFTDPFRKAATALAFIYLLGMVALIWAPETRGQPLPED